LDHLSSQQFAERIIVVTKVNSINGTRRVQTGLWMVGFGLFFVLLGLEPDLFGLDRSPVVGFVQITVFLVGLALICMGGVLGFSIHWAGKERTIAADIGLRLVSTGYVVAVTSGLADIFGFGTQPWPRIPLFGPLQARGVMVGEAFIVVGFLLMIAPRARR
jgi:hypothetical protein